MTLKRNENEQMINNCTAVIVCGITIERLKEMEDIRVEWRDLSVGYNRKRFEYRNRFVAL